MTDSLTKWCERIEIADNDCWIWIGAKWARYGKFYVRPKRHSAHRWGYEALVGPIPDGLELDHLCRNLLCVNPDHLEPVTHEENVRRGIVGAVNRARQRAVTHCPKGHPYNEQNTYYAARGSRNCRVCGRERRRLRRLNK